MYTKKFKILYEVWKIKQTKILLIIWLVFSGTKKVNAVYHLKEGLDSKKPIGLDVYQSLNKTTHSQRIKTKKNRKLKKKYKKTPPKHRNKEKKYVSQDPIKHTIVSTKKKINIKTHEEKRTNNPPIREELNRFKTTLLHQSVIANQRNNVKVFLKNGLDVNAQDERGNTPLHLAVYELNKSIIKLLLSYGANKFIKNKLGESPFELAVKFGLENTIA